MKKSRNPGNKSSTHNRSKNEPTHDEIAAVARAIWEQEGRPEGRNVEHWLQAEKQLRQRRKA